MHPLFLMFTATMSGWLPLLALWATALLVGTFSHQGSFDLTAIQDLIASQCLSNIVALGANATLAAALVTGAQDVVLINTANAPGTQTTRTAAQLLADLTASLGYVPAPGYQWFLLIVHQGTGTLTLAGGTGVTLGTGTNSVATTGNRTYVCTLTAAGSSPAITIQTTGSGSA